MKLMTFERLEPYAVKVARTVLRREGRSDLSNLSDHNKQEDKQEESWQWQDISSNRNEESRMKYILVIIIFSIILVSCNQIDDSEKIDTEDDLDSFSDFVFRLDIPIYVLISEKYGITDLRLINAMREYKDIKFNLESDILNFDITENSLLDSAIIKFHNLSFRHKISPDTLASALLDLKFAEECD